MQPGKCSGRDAITGQPITVTFDLAGCMTVERIANGSAELRQIDMIDAVADFFVASKKNANRTVRKLRRPSRAGLLFAARLSSLDSTSSTRNSSTLPAQTRVSLQN